jgi:catechol 2,3-dioxygenase-like lactoylglutathione lyase family enzyme
MRAGKELGGMPIGKLHEVILFVEDMGRQVAFYRDQLGLEVTHPRGVDDLSGQYWVSLDTGACTLALHGGGKRRLGEDAPRLVFHVEDVDAAREELVRKGVAMDPVRVIGPGVRTCDGRDPEGNKLSIQAGGAA